MAELRLAVAAQVKAEDEVKRLDAELKRAKATLLTIKEKLLPEKMAACRLKKFATDDGIEVDVREEYRVSIPKEGERRPECFAWLDAYAAIVKRQIIITFDKEQEARARMVEARLARYKDPLPMVTELEVHAATLGAMANERYREGKALPECFKPFPQKIAKIKHTTKHGGEL